MRIRNFYFLPLARAGPFPGKNANSECWLTQETIAVLSFGCNLLTSSTCANGHFPSGYLQWYPSKAWLEHMILLPKVANWWLKWTGFGALHLMIPNPLRFLISSSVSLGKEDDMEEAARFPPVGPVVPVAEALLVDDDEGRRLFCGGYGERRFIIEPEDSDDGRARRSLNQDHVVTSDL